MYDVLYFIEDEGKYDVHLSLQISVCDVGWHNLHSSI